MCEDELIHNLLARVADLEERVGAIETELAKQNADLKGTVERREAREGL